MTSLRTFLSRRRRSLVSRGPVLFTLMLVLLLLAPDYSSGHVGTGNFTDILTNFAQTGPIALAVGLGILLGEFDVSVVATYGLGAMLVTKINVDPYLVAAIAAVVGACIGATQGAVVAWLRINAVPVTFGGFLAVSGVVSILGHGNNTIYSRLGVTLWMSRTVVWALTPAALIVLGLFVLVGSGMRFTRLGREVRAVGSDKRAAVISGVSANRVIIGTFAVGGAVAGFGGAIFGFSSASALSAISFDQIITAVTAVVVGGLSLAGGYGTAGQMLIGVLTMSMFSELLAVTGANPNLVTMVTGLFLAGVAVLTPELRDSAYRLARLVPGRERFSRLPDVTATGSQ